MKLYLIGSLRNPRIPEIANALEAACPGVTVFADWHAAGPTADDAWRDYEKARGRTFRDAILGEAARHVFEFDRDHLLSSDAALLVRPAGMSGGIELGAMWGLKRPTCILLDDPERYDVMLRFADRLCTTIDEAAEWAREVERSRSS